MTYHILARVIILLLFVWIYVTGVNSERCQNTFHRNANGTLDLVFNCTTRDKYDFCKIMEFTRYHTEHTCIFSESRGHLNKVHCYPSDFSSKIDYSPDQSENQCVLKIKGINPLGTCCRSYSKYNTKYFILNGFILSFKITHFCLCFVDDSIVDDYTTNLQWLIYLFVGTVIVALGAIMILVAIKEKKYKCRSYAAAEGNNICYLFKLHMPNYIRPKYF